MMRSRGSSLLLGLAVVLYAGSAFATAVTWSALSGGKAAKLVYARGNGDMFVKDMLTGSETMIRNVGSFSGDHWSQPCPSWTPDGTRICHSKGYQLHVLNADGSSNQDLGGNPHTGNDWYDDTNVFDQTSKASGAHVLRQTLNSSNSITGTTTVYGVDNPSGQWREYLTRAGNYCAWGDARAMSNGDNRPVILTIGGSVFYPIGSGNDDGCNMQLNPDGSGKFMFCHNTHSEAEYCQYDATVIDTIDGPTGGDVHFTQWSNESEYYCHVHTVTSTPNAYIRLLSDSTGDYVSLGNDVWAPDLWVTQGPVASITVTYPDGGESWTSGSGETRTITWDYTGTVGNVNIDLSINTGSSFPYPLAANTANDGTQLITVPDVNSSLCRVRVRETDGSPSDMSDANFTITLVDTTPPAVSVTSVVVNGTASDTEINPPLVLMDGIELGFTATFSEEVTVSSGVNTITIEAKDTANTTTIDLDVTVP